MDRPIRVLCLEHEDHAGSGVFGEAAAARGASVQRWRVDRCGPPDDVPPFDAAIVLGGSMHATQEDLHDWIRPEIDLIGGWVAEGLPVLGICLGSQLLCRAVGGTVRPARTPEIGWLPVEFDAGDDRLLAHLPPMLVALQWHSYESVPPESVVTLGRSDVCVQAFRAGDCAWGLQFHAETVRDDLEHWIAQYHRDRDAVRVGFDPQRALAALDEHIGAWNDVGRSIAERFLDHVEARRRSAATDLTPMVHAHGPRTDDAAGARATNEARS
jgi:GMP synthase-like glutamine amidotransferase